MNDQEIREKVFAAFKLHEPGCWKVCKETGHDYLDVAEFAEKVYRQCLADLTSGEPSGYIRTDLKGNKFTCSEDGHFIVSPERDGLKVSPREVIVPVKLLEMKEPQR